jgi:hypothetical protein
MQQLHVLHQAGMPAGQQGHEAAFAARVVLDYAADVTEDLRRVQVLRRAAAPCCGQVLQWRPHSGSQRPRLEAGTVEPLLALMAAELKPEVPHFS